MKNPFVLAKIMKSVHSAKYYVSQGLRKIIALNIENKKLSL